MRRMRKGGVERGDERGFMLGGWGENRGEGKEEGWGVGGGGRDEFREMSP